MNVKLTVYLSTVLLASSTAFAQDFGVDMPSDPGEGRFPASETTINGWVFGEKPDPDAIYEHAWSIWAGLTAPAKQPEAATATVNALVYQTWLSPAAIIDLMNGNDSAPVLNLRTPLQHLRGKPGPSLLAEPSEARGGYKVDYSVAEVVAYSPPSARHAFTNKLLWTDTLNDLVENGYTQLPPFPYDAVNIKPVYKLISNEKLNGDIYTMPAWPGTPDVSKWNVDQQAAGFPNSVWDQCVHIDISIKGPSSARGADTTCANPDETNTYGLGDFISIPIIGNDQAYFQSLTDGQVGNLKEGDMLILVGMHVTTRETQRWTWQTFWWAANPDQPNSPSSQGIAEHRPTVLSIAAKHYAMATAYSMLSPAQPLVGGFNIGGLKPAYNPHLEATFGSHTFGETRAVQTPTRSVTTNLGVQSNCMSCHALAGYATDNSTYVSNFYVPLDASNLDNGLSVDFAWSIAVEAKPKPGQGSPR